MKAVEVNNNTTRVMRKLTQEMIVETVCSEFGVTPDMLQLRSRRDPLPTVRALIAHYLYRELGMFPREILPYTGHPVNKRTAVYHYLGRRTLVERTAPYDKALRQKMDNIRIRLEDGNITCPTPGC